MFSKRLKFFLFLLTVALIPLEGRAGFEWIAPQELPKPRGEKPVMPRIIEEPAYKPGLPQEKDPLIPRLLEKKADSYMPAPPPALEKIEMMDLSPQDKISFSDEPLSINPYPLQESPMKAVETGQYEEVAGFGTDIPLALALQQIIPESYVSYFGEGVDQGQPVSWNGGRPWNEVVAAMIAPFGLQADIKDHLVFIGKE